MKRIYTVVAMLLIACFSFAQLVQKEVIVKEPVFKGDKFTKEPVFPEYLKNNKRTKGVGDSRWYCYALTMDAYWNGHVFNRNFLFPDTTILVYYGAASGYSGPWNHSLADVFDPTSVMFNDPTLHQGELAISKNDSYSLDSIMFYVGYMRHLAGVTDTLRVEVYQPTALLSGYYFAGGQMSSNLGADTVKFIGVNYDYAKNALDIPGKVTIDILLTDATMADTVTGGWSEFKIAPNLPDIPLGSGVATAISFIPGYTWNKYGGSNPSPTPDSLASMNWLQFVAYKEVDGLWPYYTKGDYNVANFGTTEVRYNNAGSWNGMYIPSLAWQGNPTSTWPYDHFTWSYKATCKSGPCLGVGMNDISKTNDVALGNAYPNPTNGSSEVIVPVNVKSEDVVLIVTDVIGKVIVTLNYNELVSGKAIINTLGLESGVYFYTLKDNNSSATKKLTIVK